MNDPINPNHYKGGIECIDAIKEALGLGFRPYLRGQVMKYLWRCDKKENELQDLQKAEWYLNRLICELSQES